jgi:PIN domain nuclease of toxin-antitoxin system
LRLLLDSHVLLWFAATDPSLATDVDAAILDGANQVLISVASVWELEVKRRKGTLQTPTDVAGHVNSAGFDLLEIGLDHVVRAAELPSHHRDPFDRLLVAQAQSERAVLVTGDAALERYDVPIMRARA